MKPDIAILLTGTIIPHSSFVVHTDPKLRRDEYIIAIKYYSQFCPVYFLENSEYDVFADPEFSSCTNVTIRKFPVSAEYSRGKGFQEFEMIDKWLETEKNPPRRIIKITGRYIIKNFHQIFSECRNVAEDICLIDLYRKPKVAISSLFSITLDNYSRYFKGAYLECDDQIGVYIEHILFKRINSSNLRTLFFQHEPRVCGISGSTGTKLSGRHIIYVIKDQKRFIYNLFHQKSL
jgi:hypothetical protein